MALSKLIILCMIAALFLVYYRINEIKKLTGAKPLRYCRLNGSDLMIVKNTTLQLFKQSLETEGKYEFTYNPVNANLLFFNLLADYPNLYDTVNQIDACSFIYGILTIDRFASKSEMYRYLKSILPEKVVNEIMPKTYLLSKDELWKFNKEYDSSKLYIFKKNIQRQTGVKITRKIQNIQNFELEGYVVCQELLTDNFLVSRRKINIRKYAIIVVKKDVRVYLYYNGFIYYAKSPYNAQSSSENVHITTGYIDREIYDENPLTLQELYQQLGPRANHLKQNIVRTLRTVFDAYKPLLKIQESRNAPKTNFVILGCDIAIDSKLNVKLMEINKGPDMGVKDDRDGLLKQDLVSQSLRVSGAISGEARNLIRII